ncbi:MAG: DUF3858 domain-containing protein [Tenacibaculum sp.]
MKNTLLILTCFLSLISFSQKKKSTKLGNVSLEELKLAQYNKDSTANAVVLYEHANYYLDEEKEYKNTTDFYFKVKILNKEAAHKATIKVPFYGKETVHSIKGITYNLSEEGNIKKNHLVASEIFTKDKNEKWKEISFTLPNIKSGSVIEYIYSVTSPYSSIDDWDFQSDIPKIKSDFTAAILGNWKYNIRAIGFQKLSRSDVSVKKNCVYIPGLGRGSCLVLNYGMDNIPAFKEEDHMLSKENFISKIVFDLETYTDAKGSITRYTKTWKDADRKLKYNFLDNQASKKKYFKKKLNANLFTSNNNLEKANQIFNFIQNHFTWNEKYWPSRKVNIKNAFEKKTGNIFDINLSLYNSLQAAEIESYLVLTATRDKAIPTKLYPIINDFNYLIVKAIINGKTYFLDATNKNLPFGLIQHQALNGDGRVMDFKNGSYWETIQLKKRTYRTTKAQLSINSENELEGNLIISSNGYFGVNDREELNSKDTESIIETFESEHPILEVDDFNHNELNNNNKALQQIYTIKFDEFEDENKFRINPFLITRKTKNPFKLNKRDYPVDYGYPRSETYILSLKLPENYTVKKLPEKQGISLPNKGGRFILNYKNINNTINVYSKIIINKKLYSSDEYHYLKEFYNQIIKAQDAFIEIEKKTD